MEQQQQRQNQEDGDEEPLPVPAFQVYYCEMQAWGPQRCKSKVLNQQQAVDAEEKEFVSGEDRNGREYSMMIDNLRMATKYSFHVRQIDEEEQQQPKGRRIDKWATENGLDRGEMIIIPTKGCECTDINNPLGRLN